MHEKSHSSTKAHFQGKIYAQTTAIRTNTDNLPTELSENMQEYDESNKAQ
jgi:hypothetical protein